MNWNCTNVPLDEKLVSWIKRKIEGVNHGEIMIKIQKNRVVSIHSYQNENINDVNSEQFRI